MFLTSIATPPYFDSDASHYVRFPEDIPVGKALLRSLTLNHVDLTFQQSLFYIPKYLGYPGKTKTTNIAHHRLRKKKGEMHTKKMEQYSCVLLIYVHGKSGRPGNLTTLFLGRLRPLKRLTNTSCTYFRQ